MKNIERFQALEKAVIRLKEALDVPNDNPIRTDALIQRFEFTIELFWKVFKDRLEPLGIDVRSPSAAFKEAFYQGWMGQNDENDNIWIKMLKDRNLTSHTYNEDLAQEIAERIEIYYPVLNETYNYLKSKVED